MLPKNLNFVFTTWTTRCCLTETSTFARQHAFSILQDVDNPLHNVLYESYSVLFPFANTTADLWLG